MPVIAAAVEPEPVPDEAVVTKRLSVPEHPKRYVLGCAYPASRPDGHHEWASPESVEKAAWAFAQGGRRVGFFHAGSETEGHIDVCESYIYRGPNWVLKDIGGNEQTIRAGDWMLGGIADEPAFDMIISESADGWSIDGQARRRSRPLPL
jgi:hypothetical protein